jgi:hypothetical protein
MEQLNNRPYYKNSATANDSGLPAVDGQPVEIVDKPRIDVGFAF